MCHIYIYLYTRTHGHAHTFSCRPHTFTFSCCCAMRAPERRRLPPQRPPPPPPPPASVHKHTLKRTHTHIRTHTRESHTDIFSHCTAVSLIEALPQIFALLFSHADSDVGRQRLRLFCFFVFCFPAPNIQARVVTRSLIFSSEENKQMDKKKAVIGAVRPSVSGGGGGHLYFWCTTFGRARRS